MRLVTPHLVTDHNAVRLQRAERPPKANQEPTIKSRSLKGDHQESLNVTDSAAMSCDPTGPVTFICCLLSPPTRNREGLSRLVLLNFFLLKFGYWNVCLESET